jgi:hypothetical protein
MQNSHRTLKAFESALHDLHDWPDPDEWTKWVKTHRDRGLFIYCAGSTAKHLLQLKARKLPNVFVTRSKTGGHNAVPLAYWKSALMRLAYTRKLERRLGR